MTCIQKNKKYITDGLVFGFDGISNYNVSSSNVTLKNKMAYFNGTNSYVSYPRYQSDYITYEADFMAEDVQENKKIISSTENGGCQLYIKEGIASFRIFINNEYKKISYNIENNTQYHLVGTYNGKKICLYVNGNLINTMDINGKMGWNTKDTITAIGAEPAENKIATTGNYFKGYIKSVRVYNRALTADEVKNNYEYEKSNIY